MHWVMWQWTGKANDWFNFIMCIRARFKAKDAPVSCFRKKWLKVTYYGKCSLIENNYLGDWVTVLFRVNPWLLYRYWNCQSTATILLRTPVNQVIMFNQGMLLVGSNHFLNGKCCSERSITWMFFLFNIMMNFFQLRQEYKESNFKQYWMPDENCKECYECGEKFNTFRRRHHCRLCGQIFCYRCCYLEIPGLIMGYTGKYLQLNLTCKHAKFSVSQKWCEGSLSLQLLPWDIVYSYVW